MELLLATLRGHPSPAADDRVWAEAFDLAAEHQVLPTFAAQLQQAPPSAQPIVQGLLANAQRQAAVEGFFWSRQLAALLQAFAAADLPVLPLKGPFLAHRLYGDAALRPARDLDLLVRPAHIPPSEALLRSLGFTPAPYPDDYHRSWARDGLAVELHFDVENPLAFDFHLPSAWERASLGSFRGQPAWQLHPQDEFLYLCLHGLRHGYQRLSYVLDVVKAAQKLNPTEPLRPQAASLFRLMLLGTALAERLSSDGSPGPLAAPAQMREKMQALADQLWDQLLTESPVAQDWAVQHRLYLQSELSPGDKLKRGVMHLQILSTRVIQADYDFAARFGLHRRWQIRLMRLVRLSLRFTARVGTVGLTLARRPLRKREK